MIYAVFLCRFNESTCFKRLPLRQVQVARILLFLRSDEECGSFKSNTKHTPTEQKSCVAEMTQLALDKESGRAVAKNQRCF